MSSTFLKTVRNRIIILFISVKEGTPSEKELEVLSSNIGTAWKRLGRCLDLTEPRLTGFHKENEEYSEKLNILSKSRYNVDLILVMYYISAGQTSLLQVQ